MKVIAVNGSFRKNWNTHKMLTSALEGAASRGAETELVNLFDVDFKGCIGCLGCKRKGGVIGRCALKDGLTPILDSIHKCDALIIGSPIYLGEVTGVMRSFIERLLFQYISYDKDRTPLFGRKLPSACIYTMNAPGHVLDDIGYTAKFKAYEETFERILGGPCQTILATETWQTEDYDKFHMTMMDVPARVKRHEEVFPEDCRNAYNVGAKLGTRKTTKPGASFGGLL